MRRRSQKIRLMTLAFKLSFLSDIYRRPFWTTHAHSNWRSRGPLTAGGRSCFRHKAHLAFISWLTSLMSRHGRSGLPPATTLSSALWKESIELSSRWRAMFADASESIGNHRGRPKRRYFILLSSFRKSLKIPGYSSKNSEPRSEGNMAWPANVVIRVNRSTSTASSFTSSAWQLLSQGLWSTRAPDKDTRYGICN